MISLEENGRVITLKGYRIRDNCHTLALRGVLQELSMDNEADLCCTKSQPDPVINNTQL